MRCEQPEVSALLRCEFRSVLPAGELSTVCRVGARDDGAVCWTAQVILSSPWMLLPLLLVHLPQAVPLAVTDMRELRLPNRPVAVLSGTVLLAVLLVAALVPQARTGLPFALVAALVLGLLAIVVALLSPALLGMGDAKLLPIVVLLSAALHPLVLIGALGGMLVVGAAVGAIVLALKGPRAHFAFGPVLLAGPVLGLALAPLLARALHV